MRCFGGKVVEQGGESRRKWYLGEVSKRKGGFFLGGIRLCISGKMTEEKLEEGE